MTSYSTRNKLTFTLTARPVTVTWTQSWAISVICTQTIAQTWITVAWIHWKNIILYTNSWCSKSNTIPNMYILQLRFVFLAPSITPILCSTGNYQEGIWIFLILFNPTTFQCLTHAMTWISSDICLDFFSFCVQWFEVRNVSFCWYLWSNTTGATSGGEGSSYPSGAPQPVSCLVGFVLPNLSPL
jgi:hypothetical protein